jgi:N-acyl-D-aspartate/D-glutamate deacylase
MNQSLQWDLLIKNAKVFDGTGGAPELIDIAIKDGVFAAKGKDLDSASANDTLDASGQWLMPGLVDIHTHFDLEVEVEPGLPEAVRHGSTSLVMSNCSLGVAFGKQENPEKPEERPIVDCFARVENIPKAVIAKCVDQITWDNTADYLDHFYDIPLGPNVAPMIPHSMLRIEVMGLEESIKRHATKEELDRMVELTQKALDEGYVGFSIDMLPLHYLANDPHRSARIPTQIASFEEIKTLANVIRENERTWQATPDPENMLYTFKLFALTSGKLHGKTMKTTATAAMDLNTNKRGAKSILTLSKLLNSNFMKGNITFQALSAPFKVYADGVTTPLLEEKPAFRDLNAFDTSDREGRQKLLSDPAFQERFRHDWGIGKRGFNVDRLKRSISMEPTTFGRNLNEMWVESCPVKAWNGLRMDELMKKVQGYQNGDSNCSEEEKQVFDKFPKPLLDDADFMLTLLMEFDKDLRWYTYTANTNPEVLKHLLFHPLTIPGFNDSGAHLTNMAFYDGNLRTLKLAAEDSEEMVAYAVKRLTKDAADIFDLDAGTLDIGAQADVLLVDPNAFKAYDPDKQTVMIYRDIFEHDQMVNRPEGVVQNVLIAGKYAVKGGELCEALGKERFGRPLRNKDVERKLKQGEQASAQVA